MNRNNNNRTNLNLKSVNVHITNAHDDSPSRSIVKDFKTIFVIPSVGGNRKYWFLSHADSVSVLACPKMFV